MRRSRRRQGRKAAAGGPPWQCWPPRVWRRGAQGPRTPARMIAWQLVCVMAAELGVSCRPGLRSGAQTCDEGGGARRYYERKVCMD